MRRLAIPFILLFSIFLLSSCEQKTFNVDLKTGGYYSVNHDEFSFGIAKIIAMDDKGFFVQFYKDTFQERPDRINPDELVPADREQRYKAMPRREFFSLVPIYITVGKIRMDEFTAYELWKMRSGGKWEPE